VEQTKLAESLNLIYQPHPIAPLAGRKSLLAVTDGATTVRSVLISAGIDPYQPITVQLDGRMLTVEDWDIICPVQDQMLNVHATVQGGGGDSNVIMVVALIAIAIAAPYAGAALAGAAGLTGTALAVGTAVFTAAVQISGTLVVGALFAPKAQGMPNAPPAVSPTYSLSGGSNRARPYEPMPAVMGTHRLFLDYAARPFTEYRGNDQYLYQIFNLGLGTLSASDYKIGTTSLSSYSDVTFVNPDVNGRLPDFPANVDTASGAALTNTAGYITRTTSIDTYQIGIDLESVIFFANNSGDLEARSVELEIEFKLSSSATFVNPTSVEIYGDNFTYAAGIITTTGSSQKPNRATIYIKGLTPDTYDVRIRRLTTDSDNSKLQSQTNWSALRSYQLDDADYKGQNRVGLIIRATEQLNGSVQTLSAIVEAQSTFWNGTAFVTALTDNPAHIFTHFARGVRNADGNLMYGVGLADNQIDFDSLVSWANFCTDEGLSFNGVLDTNLTAADVLNSIGVTGFASPTWASGKLGVVFDSRNASPVMTFGMSNIIRDSFEVAYISENLAEEIVIRFSDPTRDYEQNEVRTLAPDVVTPTRTSSIDLYGCTDEDMAGKFANYIAAQQYYRRRRVTWQSDFEGFVCQRGDVVLLSHDLTQWGYSGRFVTISGLTVRLDRAVPRNDEIEYIMLIRPDGTTSTYDVAASETESDTLTLVNFPVLQSGANLLDHRWAFSPLATTGKKLKILSVQPASESRLQIVATDEPSEFYDAWDGTFVAPPIETVLPQQPVTVTNLSLSNRVAFVNGYLTNRVAASWNVGGGTLYSLVRVYLGGNLITEITEAKVPYVELDVANAGLLLVEVTPFGLTGSGLTQTSTLTLSALDFPAPPDTVTLEVGEYSQAATFAWTPVLGVQSYVIEIVVSGAVVRQVNVGNTLSYVYTVQDARADGGAFRAYTFRVYSANQAGQSLTFASVSFNNPQILQLQNASVEPMPNSVWFNCDLPIENDFKAIRVYASKTQGFTPSAANVVADGENAFVNIAADNLGNPLESGVVYYVRAAAYDTFGDDNLTFTAELSAIVLSPVFGLLQGDIQRVLLESGLRDEIETNTIEVTETLNKYTVKINNDGYISGYGLISTENNAVPFSDFIVIADRFSISPTASAVDANPASPFFVLTAATVIDGVTVEAGTYIKKANIYTASIVTAKIADAAITNAKIANATIDTAKITNAAITTALIGDAQITTAKIADLAVENAKIANLDATKIDTGFLSADRIQAGTIDAKLISVNGAVIQDATIANAKISALDAAKINTGTLSADRIAVGSIDAKIANIGAAVITSGTLNTARIGDASILTAKIGTAQIDTLRVAGNAITVQASAAANLANVSFAINAAQAGVILIIVSIGGSQQQGAFLRVLVNGGEVGIVQGQSFILDNEGNLGRTPATKQILVSVGAGTATISTIYNNQFDYVISGFLSMR